MKRINQYGFVAIMATILTLLVIKALTLPVVNDEMPTALTYINNHVWEIMMYTDNWPNNHILNTLFVKLFVFLFGNTQLVIRLPNLLSFILFGIAIFRINKTILKIDSFFFLPAALLFVSNQFVIDYFALCRGYGMASALATLSASYLITGFGRSKSKHIWIAYFLSILSSYANFTLLVFWCATSLLVLLYFAKERMSIKKLLGPVMVMFIISLLYLALIANPIIKMHSTDEFQYWSSKGFYWDTIYPFIRYSLGARHRFLFPTSHVIAAFIFMTIIANLIYMFFQFRKNGYDARGFRLPVFVSTALLLATAGINILQCHILKIPNLHGRTALFFYPLFIIVFVAFLGIWPAVKARALQLFVAGCFAFICIFHMSNTFKFNWVNDYYFDADTLNVLEFLKDQNGGKKVSLKTTWFCYGSFDYYVETGKASWLELKDYDKSIDINTNADYYYLFSKDAKALESKFEPVATYGDRVLLEKR